VRRLGSPARFALVLFQQLFPCAGRARHMQHSPMCFNIGRRLRARVAGRAQGSCSGSTNWRYAPRFNTCVRQVALITARVHRPLLACYRPSLVQSQVSGVPGDDA
jgi:hypothetical protein